MITQFPLDRITDNPYNERGLDQANVDTIAASIKADGLLQPPLGRWLDGTAEPSVQLAFGHHRLAAYRKLQTQWNRTPHEQALPNPWDSIPVDVRELDDITMARYAIVENHHRSDPSAIERARALLRLTGELHMTQAEAGALFGLKSQASVAHLTALLRLPDDVQQLVHTGEIAQAAARALLPLMHFQPAAVSKIAKDSLEEDPDDRSEAIQGEIRNLLDRKAQSLATWGRPWPLEWPAKPLAIDDNRKEKGEPSEIPPCRGCQFAVLKDPKADPQGRLSFCLRKPCFEAKGRAWGRLEVARASEKLGIPVAAPGETVSVVFAGSYQQSDQQRAARLVRSKLPELRLAPHAGSDTQGLQDVLGTKSAMLVTTSNMAVTKYLNETKGKPVGTPAKSANETPAQAERRKVAEVEQREERALERMATNRARADVLWLVEHTAELIAERAVAAGGLLVLAEHLTQRFFNVGLDEMKATQGRLAKLADVGTERFEKMLAHKAGPATPETDQRRRQLLAYTVLASEIAGYQNATKVYAAFEKACTTAAGVASKTFGVELPNGWATPPVHHTPINCWTCGRFSSTGSGQLNQNDLREGWREAWETANGQPAQGAALQSVLCPSHAYFQSPGKGRGYPGATSQQKALESYDRAVKALAKLTSADRAAAAMRANLVKLEILTMPASNKCAKCGKPMIGKGPVCINCLQGAETDAAAKAKPAEHFVDQKVLGEIIGTQMDHALLYVKKANLPTLRTALAKTTATGHDTMVHLAIQKRINKLTHKPVAAKATAAALVLAAKAPYGRSHTRPAPKPSAAKRRKVAKKGK